MYKAEPRTIDERKSFRELLPADNFSSTFHERQDPREEPRNSVDRNWSVVLLASLTGLVTIVSLRNSGFFFVHFREELAGSSREAAAWPVSVLQAFSQLGGFPVAFVGQRLDVFQIALAGSLLVWIGLALTAFASNLFWITILFGVVHGGGVGLVLVCLDKIVMLYFDRYRGFANGIKCAAFSVSSFVSVHLLSVADKTLGFHSTLIMFAVTSMLTTILCYMLQRLAEEDKLRVRKEYEESKKASMGGYFDEFRITRQSERSNRQFQTLRDGECSQSPLLSQGNYNLVEACHADCEGADVITVQEVVPYQSRFAPEENIVANRTVRNVWYQKPFEPTGCKQNSKFLQDLVYLCSLFKDPTFAVLMAFKVISCFSVFFFLETLVDYALDKGALRYEAEWNIAIFSVASLFGTLVVPAVSDSRYIGRWTLAALVNVWLAASFIWLSRATSAGQYSLAVASTAVCAGSVVNLRTVLLADYLPQDLFTISLGLSGTILTPIVLYFPAVIGYYRDKGGSYDNLYCFLGFLQACSGGVLLALLYSGRGGKAQK